MPVLAQGCQGWLKVDKDRRIGRLNIVEFRKAFRLSWSNRRTVEAIAAVSLMAAASLSIPIPSSVACLAFQGFEQDKMGHFDILPEPQP